MLYSESKTYSEHRQTPTALPRALISKGSKKKRFKKVLIFLGNGLSNSNIKKFLLLLEKETTKKKLYSRRRNFLIF